MNSPFGDFFSRGFSKILFVFQNSKTCSSRKAASDFFASPKLSVAAGVFKFLFSSFIILILIFLRILEYHFCKTKTRPQITTEVVNQGRVSPASLKLRRTMPVGPPCFVRHKFKRKRTLLPGSIFLLGKT